MATTIITRVYSSYDRAVEVVRDLEAADIPHSDITLVSPRDPGKHGHVKEYQTPGEEAREGETVYGTAVGGGVLGGIGGLLAGLGLIAIPGAGPIVAAGWLAATLAGATIGTAAGAAAEEIANGLTRHGVSREEAKTYAHSVTSGGSLVSCKIEETQRGMVESIMGLNQTGSVLGETVDPETGRSAA